MSEARVRVSLTDGVLEFEGPEDFVARLVDKFGSVIQKAIAGESPDAKDVAAAADNGSGDVQSAVPTLDHVAGAPPSPKNVLSDIFAVNGSGVQVLRAVPGPSKAMRAVNLVKLYLYGLRTLKQRDTALFAEIARVCKTHGCYDPNNMAACLKADRTSFVFGGTGRRQTLKLSAPGINGTEALIARMRPGGNGIS